MTLLPAGTVLCRVEALREGEPLGFALGEGDWPLRALVLREGGVVRAYLNQCPHAGHRLDFPPGRFLASDGHHLLCRSHGALFDKRSGECVSGPCAGESLKSVPVTERDGDVCLATELDVDALATRYW